MRSFLSMFSKSPFKPLTSHMEKVRSCVDQVLPLFQALTDQDFKQVFVVSEKIVKLEHEADLIKDSIRSQVPQSVFLPVDKRDFMHLLSAQDDIADAVEDLAVLLRIKILSPLEEIKQPLGDLVSHVIDTAYSACDLILELDGLLEASFGGGEAERIEKGAQSLGEAEYEADKKQFLLAQKLFSLEDKLSAGELYLWNEVVKKLGGVADKSEQIGKTLRLFLSR